MNEAVVPPEPIVAFETTAGTVASTIEAAFAAIERTTGLRVERPADVATFVAGAERELAEKPTGVRPHRRGLLLRFEALVNAALTTAGDPRRLARLVVVDGAEVPDARFLLVTPAERDALRKTGRYTFVPWPKDFWRSLWSLPLAIAFGWLVWRASEDGRAEAWIPVALAWVAWFAMRTWLRRTSVGLAIGANAPG